MMRWRFNQSERSEGSKCQRKTGQESSVPAANFVFSDSEQKVSSSFSLFHPLPAWLDNINIHGIWIYSLHIAVHYLGIFPHMDVVFYLGVLYFLVLRQYLMGLFINWLYIGSRGENIDRQYIVQSIIVLYSQYREVWSPQLLNKEYRQKKGCNKILKNRSSLKPRISYQRPKISIDLDRIEKKIVELRLVGRLHVL